MNSYGQGDILAFLGDESAASPHGHPRCRMCARPARIVNGQPASYCCGTLCMNPERLCQGCGRTFATGSGVRNNKYCSVECSPVQQVRRMRCAWCGQDKPVGSRAYVGSVWPYVCMPCLEPVKNVVGRLRNHHVPHERARRLIADPGCEICGVDLVTLIPQSQGRPKARLVVDHDHACCPGPESCGKCVRGFLCMRCNVALGMVGDDLHVVRRMSHYLAERSGGCRDDESQKWTCETA